MMGGARRWLKADFHVHTKEDPKDNIAYDAFQLIDRACQLGFDAIAITNHDYLTLGEELSAYAQQNDILLIPGAEITCEGKHILLINPEFVPGRNELALADLKLFSRQDTLIIAPHPYFPGFRSLGAELDRYHYLFDAIEFSAFYNHLVNPNQKALEASEKYGLPLVACSDAHNLWQLGTSFSLVEAEKSVEGIIQAVKEKRVKLSHQPLKPLIMARVMVNFLLADKLKLPWHV